MTRTYIRVTFVAMSPYGKPIATAHTEKDLKAGLDEYYGIGTDSKAKYLDWSTYDTKYPDDLEGSHRYEVDDLNGGTEIEEVKVYCVEFYPRTKYEVKDDQALTELMEHDKEAGLYDVDFKEEKTTEGKYVIIDLRNMDYMKDVDDNIMYYDTEKKAGLVCGINELENAWIMKLVYNHIEK